MGGRSLFTSKYFARSEGYYANEVASGKYSDKSDVFHCKLLSQIVSFILSV